MGLRWSDCFLSPVSIWLRKSRTPAIYFFKKVVKHSQSGFIKRVADLLFQYVKLHVWQIIKNNIMSLNFI